MDAVIMAGGIMAVDDPLYGESPNGIRSMIELMGKPMVQWVIDALDASKAVAELYLIGLSPESGITATKPLHFVPDQGGMFENVRRGVIQATEDHPERSKVLVVSADIPAIQPPMVDWVVKNVMENPGQLVYYTVIPQKVMDERFPDANRSYIRLKDMAVCGGDLHAVDKGFFDKESPIWHKLTNARKHPLQQAWMIGFDTLFLIALRMITLQGTVNRVCQRLDINGKAFPSPYAELGMDADKPHQLAILRQHLEARL
jgi:GTP:adenosylcobinamide-phosphate guanylyltransferase